MANHSMDFDEKDDIEEALVPRTKKESVVSSKATQKKKSGIRRFIDDFFQGDADDIKRFLIKDILEPKLRDLVTSAVDGAVDTWVFGPGGASTSKKSKKKSILSSISYNSMFDDDYYDYNYRKKSSRSRSSSDEELTWDNLVFEDRADAVGVKAALELEIEQHDAASIMDLCDFAEIAEVKNTYAKFGWTDISDANTKIVRTHDGRWELKLPKARPL